MCPSSHAASPASSLPWSASPSRARAECPTRRQWRSVHPKGGRACCLLPRWTGPHFLHDGVSNRAVARSAAWCDGPPEVASRAARPSPVDARRGPRHPFQGLRAAVPDGPTYPTILKKDRPNLHLSRVPPLGGISTRGLRRRSHGTSRGDRSSRTTVSVAKGPRSIGGWLLEGFSKGSSPTGRRYGSAV